MAVTFRTEVATSATNTSKPACIRKHHRKPVAPVIALDQPGHLHIANLQALFGCSHGTVYRRMKQGLIPEPDGYPLANRPKGKRGRPYWYTATIRALLEPTQ